MSQTKVSIRDTIVNNTATVCSLKLSVYQERHIQNSNDKELHVLREENRLLWDYKKKD